MSAKSSVNDYIEKAKWGQHDKLFENKNNFQTTRKTVKIPKGINCGKIITQLHRFPYSAERTMIPWLR